MIKTFKIRNVEFNMVLVKGSTFRMLDTFTMSNNYGVTLDDYYIGETQVTQELWRSVIGCTGYHSPSRFKGDQLPVENVSWNDITGKEGFLDRLNEALEAQIPAGMKFSLPTEAQWEFASRGGVKHNGKDFTYIGSDNINDVAWYAGNSGEKTQPVKLKKANELGLYDMSGNVWEWCQDLWSDDYQKVKFNHNSGRCRVLRGGSWCSSAERCRSDGRVWDFPDGRLNVGFRLALY